MIWKNPKNTREFYWTNHALFKMRCYGLSVQKVLGVIKRPERKAEGIVKNTIAVMQPVNPKILNGKKIWRQEVWVMYQLRDSGAISKSQFPISNKISAEGGPAVGWHFTIHIIILMKRIKLTKILYSSNRVFLSP